MQKTDLANVMARLGLLPFTEDMTVKHVLLMLCTPKAKSDTYITESAYSTVSGCVKHRLTSNIDRLRRSGIITKYNPTRGGSFGLSKERKYVLTPLGAMIVDSMLDDDNAFPIKAIMAEHRRAYIETNELNDKRSEQ